LQVDSSSRWKLISPLIVLSSSSAYPSSETQSILSQPSQVNLAASGADRVVGQNREGEDGLDFGRAAKFELGQAPRQLDPAEHFACDKAARQRDQQSFESSGGFGCQNASAGQADSFSLRLGKSG
jgi:hypothetical protein